MYENRNSVTYRDVQCATVGNTAALSVFPRSTGLRLGAGTIDGAILTDIQFPNASVMTLGGSLCQHCERHSNNDNGTHNGENLVSE